VLLVADLAPFCSALHEHGYAKGDGNAADLRRLFDKDVCEAHEQEEGLVRRHLELQHAQKLGERVGVAQGYSRGGIVSERGCEGAGVRCALV